MAEVIDILSDSDGENFYYQEPQFDWIDDNADRPGIDYSEKVENPTVEKLSDDSGGNDTDTTVVYANEDGKNDLIDDIEIPLATYEKLQSPVAEPFYRSEKSNSNSPTYLTDYFTSPIKDSCTSSFKSSEPSSMPFLHDSQPATSKEALKLERERKRREKELLKESKNMELAEKKRLREEKKTQVMREKAIKTAISSKQKSMKPEECIKLMNILIDTETINAPSGSQICTMLQQNDIKYTVRSLNFPATIMWTKKIKETILSEQNEFVGIEKEQTEEDLISIVPWNKIVSLIVNDELQSYILKLKTGVRRARVTLLLFGLEKYFSYQKKKVNKAITEAITGSQQAKRKKTDLEFEAVPEITMDKLETALTEAQLLLSTNHRWVDTAEEVATIIVQFTKAISQIEYKQEKYNREVESLSWFAKGDNKSCVKVDKNGLGLLSLWQQQILQFNNVCLEVAQAVVGKYNSPQVLLAAYRNCESDREAEGLLQDIPVRREAGILSSTRRVGPELSKKIYRFLTSKDPDLEL